MFQPDLNLWAILVSGLASFALGGLWYSPVLFGNTWMHLSGLSKEHMESHKNEAMRGYAVTVVTSLVMAFVMAHVVYYTDAVSWPQGLEAGFWMWLGFIATVLLGSFLWEGKKFSLYLINAGFYLVSLLVMGVILAVWQ